MTTVMDEKMRRTYRRIGWVFVLVGAGFLALELLQEFLKLELFRGNPLRVSLLVTVIGAALLWTVRERS